MPVERAASSSSRRKSTRERGCGDGTTLALLACVVLGWPGKSTPVPLVAGARQEKDQGEVRRRVRTTWWVDGQPGLRQPRTALNSEGATRQIQDRAVGEEVVHVGKDDRTLAALDTQREGGAQVRIHRVLTDEVSAAGELH